MLTTMRDATLTIAFLCFVVAALGSKNSRPFCEQVVKQWVHREMVEMKALPRREELQGMLFFLHIPRTGGRNYNQCFLKNLFSERELCPRSYDKLRLNLSKPQCSFLSTHDDYSVVSKLPRSLTSIVTNVRSPSSRVLSAYEFSVEVSARFLKQPTLSLKRQLPLGKNGGRATSMSTLDIWPWKFLVPLMQQDIFHRRDMRNAAIEPPTDEVEDVYDAPAFVMPLKEFIEHPDVQDLVHNGATFQVAGLTNNSYFPEAKVIRTCAAEHKDLANQILEVAKARLDTMLYVGLTEKHRESAELFAHLVGKQAAQRKMQPDTNDTIGQRNSSTIDAYQYLNDTSYEGFIDNMVASYQKCSKNLRSAQVGRRITSLLPVFPVNFTKEARSQISEGVMDRILELNSLDIGLFEHAKKIFAMEQEYVLNNIEEPSKIKVVETWVRTEVEEPKRTEGAQSGNVLVGLSILVSLSALFFCFRSKKKTFTKLQRLKTEL